jgi:hypothetical protein
MIHIMLFGDPFNGIELTTTNIISSLNSHVYLVDKNTGVTREVLFITKSDMENYLEVAYKIKIKIK